MPRVFRSRAARASELSGACAAAREPLRFVAALCATQARVCEELERLHGSAPLTGNLVEDGSRIVEALRVVAACVAEHAPDSLAEEARERALERAPLLLERLRIQRGDYLARAMLRPYLEFLREHGIPTGREAQPGRCPFCAGAPTLALRRGGGTGAGAARSLVCARCGMEWSFARIRCPVCAEADPERLPVFRAPEHPRTHVEACESCRRYLKSLDLGESARGEPEIDELATIALDLWAQEQGFTRVEPGLAGV